MNCATWTSASATPSVARVGETVALAAGAVAPDVGGITFSWSATGGAIATLPTAVPGQAQATFTCPATPADVTVTLVLGDGSVPTGAACPVSSSVTTITVHCTN